jgi:DNA repair protein RadC
MKTNTISEFSTTKYSLLSDEDILTAARAILAERVRHADLLTSPDVVANYLVTQFAGLEHEVFACLLLDNRHRLIQYQELFRGTIDGCTVHPREVVKAALRCNAAAVVLAHNHPSGVAEPSAADQTLTKRLKDALALVDIRVLDHVVVGGSTAVSFAERGLL